MKLYLVAMWIAVAVNVASTIFQLYRARLYWKATDEALELMHKVRNSEALLMEHMPVERNRTDG